MLLRALQVSGVRNLAATLLEPTTRFVVLSGNNGQGKTSLLEAIYVAGTLRSFRTARTSEVITLGGAEAYVGARVESRGLERLFEVRLAAGKRVATVDGKVPRPLSRYFGAFNVVLFAPEDLQIPRGAPSLRRRFLDRTVFNFDSSHLGAVQRYERVLRSRNAILRGETAGRRVAAADLVAVYDEQLAEHGARLIEARRRFLDVMQPSMREAYEAITRSGVEAGLTYVPSLGEAPAGGAGELRDALGAALRASGPRDRARGATSVGPHRDDIRLLLDGNDAGSFGSQGQVRALILAWKTAEMRLLTERQGEPAILLLDDVSSELDPSRNEYLFSFLQRECGQCFVTTTAPAHVLIREDRTDLHVEGGKLTPRDPKSAS